MKSAAIVLALLVAGLLFAPASVSAVDLPNPEHAGQLSAWEQEAEPAAEGEDASGITELHATAARLRGRVELSWSVNDQASEGMFVVERSTNGSSWRPVKACSQRFDAAQTDYGCTDTRLTSGTTYAYRVCITEKGATCSNASPSQPVTVKAP